MHLRIDGLIELALQEDAAFGDLTSEAVFAPDHTSTAHIEAREALTVCGLEVARKVFERVDPRLKITLRAEDGERVKAGRKLLQAQGSTVSLLLAERTVLNFLQRLCGVASQAARYAAAARKTGTGVRVVDTRKTTPGWRALEKYAVRCGGCHNHRWSLGEHVLIKDNHIAAAGSLALAVKRTRAVAPHTARIEVETDTLQQVKAALKAGADAILLDNMSPEQIARAVALIDGRALIEVSGGVNLDTLADYALPGVDVISVGALTHSAVAADLSMVMPRPKSAS